MRDNLAPIRAVGFDFDHTLGLDHRLERTVGTDLLGLQAGRAVELALAAYRYGACSLDDAVSSVGIDPTRFRQLVVERAPEFVTAMPGAQELLAALARSGVQVAILTNGWSPLQERKAELIGFAGPVLVSDTLGVRKPSSSAFASLERVLGVAAANIAYVGDDPISDMCGALRAGMQGVWLDWERRSYPQDIAEPTLRVATLAGVLPFVQGPLSQTANPPA